MLVFTVCFKFYIKYCTLYRVLYSALLGFLHSVLLSSAFGSTSTPNCDNTKIKIKFQNLMSGHLLTTSDHIHGPETPAKISWNDDNDIECCHL